MTVAATGVLTLPVKFTKAMIQRIQSIFLALASLCTFGLFATDAAETPTQLPFSEVFADAHFTVFDSPLLVGGVIAAGIVTLAAIFLFNNRRLQGILCNIAVFVTLAYAAYGATLWYNDAASAQSSVELGIALPFLAIIFAILAAGYIKKDEKLVRSADRLR